MVWMSMLQQHQRKSNRVVFWHCCMYPNLVKLAELTVVIGIDEIEHDLAARANSA